MEPIRIFLREFVAIINEMSPYLMLGFLFAGILYVFFPKEKVAKFMGKNKLSSVINAALLGVPLPLCSCGVIPTGISFYNNGASKGATVSFLISTPQTGVDSILVTYSMLGLPFAIIRPIVAFITGIFGGILTNVFAKDKTKEPVFQDNKKEVEPEIKGNAIIRMFRYAFYDFLGDIAKWLVIGLIIAATISVLVPDDFFITYLHNEYLNMLIVLALATPLYVCATASVPIAAALMLKGLSPGAALVFLMAGPATNAATIMLIGKTMKRKTLFVYLFSIISGALIFGTLINKLLPPGWFILSPHVALGHVHHHEMLPDWLKTGSSILLSALIANVFLQKYLIKPLKLKTTTGQKFKFNNMEQKEIIVEGMTCTHCKMTVESNLRKFAGINEVEADVSRSRVKLIAEKINLEKVKDIIDRLGYTYKGQA